LSPWQRLAALGALATVIIWAATGVGYFWPAWVWFGVVVPIAMLRAIRWGWSQPRGRERELALHGAVSAVLAGAVVLIWALSGAGYLWPVFPLVGLGGLYAIHALLRAPQQRELAVRVDELTRTRRGALDVQAAELRRIERDLHDGAQARLVALSMQLGRAEERLADQPDTAALVRRAREEATAAIAELRDLARGIAPPVLADRGLVAAVQSIADRAGGDVTVDAEVHDRLPPVIETAAYFVVAESLTNAAKHAPGAEVLVTLSESEGSLLIGVSDRGPGGADPLGSGLTGLRQRVEALDGTLDVSSPPGRGTTIRAALPCE
jgi:signal transduction histidine kinase